MIFIAVTCFLYGILLVLIVIAWRQGRGFLSQAYGEIFSELLRLLPRLMVGVIGSGFIARLMPQDIVSDWLGPNSGALGIALACIIGALTPGGPVVGFALGAAALKAGAGSPQIIAYVTAWSLYTLNRILIWELPVMSPRFVYMRAIISAPFPFIAAYAVVLMTAGF